VWTYDCKVDYCIDPTNDEKAYDGPEEPHDSGRHSEGQGVEEIPKSKLDKVKRSPIERGEDEGPLGDVQERRDLFSERDCRLLVNGFNEVECVQKLVTGGERDDQAYTRYQDEAIVPSYFSTPKDANRKAY
jgi:hypothetical protein